MTENNKYVYDYPMQSVTATIAVLYYDKTNQQFNLLLIERKDEPYKGKFCFPGGFSEAGKETVEDAAVRELKEECGLSVLKNHLIHIDIRSDPNRDPRGHIIDIGYLYICGKTEYESVVAGDDAKSFKWMNMMSIRQEETKKNNVLAFDHIELFDKVSDFLMVHRKWFSGNVNDQEN